MEILATADRPLSVLEINAGLGLPKQTIHRLCSRLTAAGYLARAGSGKLEAGHLFHRMARGVMMARHFNIIRRQLLIDAAGRTGETINLAVPDAAGMIYIDRVESDWPLRIQFAVGATVPFHCTAGGKCYFASLSVPERRCLLERIELRRLTANTICDKDRLLDEIAQVADQGYALDNEEFLDGMVAAAVPVCGTDENFFAALAVHGPTQRLTPDAAVAARHTLLECAAKLRHSIAH